MFEEFKMVSKTTVSKTIDDKLRHALQTIWKDILIYHINILKENLTQINRNLRKKKELYVLLYHSSMIY